LGFGFGCGLVVMTILERLLGERLAAMNVSEGGATCRRRRERLLV
jgi:hypothetical protein